MELLYQILRGTTEENHEELQGGRAANAGLSRYEATVPFTGQSRSGSVL